MESLLKYVQDNLIAKKDFPDFPPGDTITSGIYEIKEGEKSRVQVLQRCGNPTPWYRSYWDILLFVKCLEK